MTVPKAEINSSWYLNRIRNVLDHEGVKGFILRAAAFIGYKCGIWLVGWYVKPIAGYVKSMDTQLPIEVIELTLSDVGDYIKSNRIVTAEVFKQRITAGNRCYAIRCDNQIASTSWVAIDRAWVEFISRDLVLSKGEIYIFDSYTHPLYRGKRLQGAISAEILNCHQAAGYEYACAMIAPENRSNIRARKRLGFRRTAWIVALKIGRLQWDSFKIH